MTKISFIMKSISWKIFSVINLGRCVMKKFLAAVGTAAFLTVGLANAEQTLYEKLGGKKAIDAVVEDLTNRMMHDKQLKRFCGNVSKDKVKTNRELVAAFICKATGGPCEYKGKDMKEAHQNLGITEKDWDRFVELAKQSLNKFKVPADVQKEFLGAVAGLKDQVVSKK
jgi:hemoglobin